MCTGRSNSGSPLPPAGTGGRYWQEPNLQRPMCPVLGSAAELCLCAQAAATAAAPFPLQAPEVATGRSQTAPGVLSAMQSTAGCAGESPTVPLPRYAPQVRKPLPTLPDHAATQSSRLEHCSCTIAQAVSTNI